MDKPRQPIPEPSELDNTEWVDCSVLGSPWEVQIDLNTNRTRYRPFHPSKPEDYDWLYGDQPD